MLNELLKAEIEEGYSTEVRSMSGQLETLRLEDIDQVNWAFRKICAYKAKIEETNSLADREVQRIETWRAKQNEEMENSIGYFEYLLQEYYMKQKQLNPKVKISTPYGKITSRKQQPKWNINDEILLHNLKASGLNNLIRVKEEINKAELKMVASVVNGKVVIDGEIIEGVEVLEQDEAIKIEVNE